MIGGRSPTYASGISSVTSPSDNDQLAELITNLNITNVSSTNNEIPSPDNIVHLVNDQPSQSTVLSPKQLLVRESKFITPRGGRGGG